MTDEKNTCPYCKENIKSGAIKCKHCHSKLAENRPNHEGVCPFCKEEINPEAIKCKHCKSNFVTGSSCKCSSNGEGDIAKVKTQIASMGNISPVANSLINKNFRVVDLPPLNCEFVCFWGPNGLTCYMACDGPGDIVFTNRLSAF